MLLKRLKALIGIPGVNRRGNSGLHGAEALESRVLLTEFVVSALGDADDGNYGEGELTLREAISEANADPDVDTIVFGDLSSGIITNTSPLEITEDVTITGLGARDFIIAGQGGSGLFVIDAGVTVTLSDMFITGGFSTRTGTQGGAIFNEGELTILRSRISGTAGQGGGIYSSGSLLLSDSTISNSFADAGGGVYVNGGIAEVVNSTFSNNAANTGTMAGGAVFVASGDVLMTNSTVVGNRAGNASSTGEGGGLFVTDTTGTLTLHNSIVAGNLGTTSDLAGSVESGSAFNIVGDADSAGGLADGVDDNIVGNAGTGQLDVTTIVETTLANNGGPTDTLLLVSESAALNSGDNSLALSGGNALTSDQRGFARIVAGTVDRGAVEAADTEDVFAFDHTTGEWWIGDSDGTWFTEVTGPRWSTAVTWNTYAGDFNGDGLSDGLGYQVESGQWFAALSDGTTLGTTGFGKWASQASAGWQYVQVGDVNGDGMDDVVGMTSTGQWWAGISDGSRFNNTYLGKWSPTGWAAIQLGDVNGDGNADLIGFRQDTGQWWAGLSTGSVIQTQYIGRWNVASTWQNFLMGDLTGDGKADIIAHDEDGAWYIATLNELDLLATIYAGRTRTDFSRGGPLLGDFNGDGLDDLLLTGTNATIYVKLSNGSGMDGTVVWGTVPEFDTLEDVRFVGDWNGDGKDDAAGYSEIGGLWKTLISDGSEFVIHDFGSWSNATTPDDFYVGLIDSL